MGLSNLYPPTAARAPFYFLKTDGYCILKNPRGLRFHRVMHYGTTYVLEKYVSFLKRSCSPISGGLRTYGQLSLFCVASNEVRNRCLYAHLSSALSYIYY